MVIVAAASEQGAQKINQFFGPWLKEQVELPDRRTDPDYESWQEQLERYHSAVALGSGYDILVRQLACLAKELKKYKTA